MRPWGCVRVSGWLWTIRKPVSWALRTRLTTTTPRYDYFHDSSYHSKLGGDPHFSSYCWLLGFRYAYQKSIFFHCITFQNEKTFPFFSLLFFIKQIQVKKAQSMSIPVCKGVVTILLHELVLFGIFCKSRLLVVVRLKLAVSSVMVALLLARLKGSSPVVREGSNTSGWSMLTGEKQIFLARAILVVLKLSYLRIVYGWLIPLLGL